MGNIETGNNRIDLPKEFNGISNQEKFIGVYEKVQSWYGESFSDNEKKIIKETWNRGCKEYGGQFNTTRLAILGNRIDTGIFEFRYPKFINMDKNIIRKINDTNRQRIFREVAIKLIKKYNNLFDSDIKIVEAEFNNAFINKKTPNFDIIDDKISQKKGKKDQNSNETNSNNENIQDNNLNNLNGNNDLPQSNNNNIWPSDNDVETMLNLKISPFFEGIKKEIFANDLFSTNPNKKYLEGFFNECANNIFELYGDIKDSDELKEELLIIFKQHLYAISQGIEKSSNELTSDIKNKIIDMRPGDSLAILVNNAFDKDDKIDYSKFIKIGELTQEDRDAIDYLCSKITGNIHTKEEITNQYLKYKHLEKKQKNGELSDKEKKDFKGLKELFRQTKRLKELEEIKGSEYIGNHKYHAKNINSSVEYATGNIKDIKPIAIVENNKQISNYIYGNKDNQEKLDCNNINLSYENKIRLFNKLKEEKKTDLIFLESIEYLNDDLSINEDLVNVNIVDINSVKNNQQKIENMVKDLALEENLEKHDKNKINEINVRRSCMCCCFRAISNFFDTVNNNGENFASEFEIKDVNENIKFDGKVITMEGTIGVNRNHVKLYYDTKTGELSFDNFLDYDPVNGYQIGKGNGAKRKLEVKLPTMEEMENNAKSVNLDLIGKISMNMSQYNRMVGFAMNESIWLNSFRGYIGDNLEANKLLIQKFNEENILKQDIIHTIYSKFYNQEDLDEKLNQSLSINEKTEPAQFKLIDLISKSIDHYEGDANQLLRFRNYINKLDNILTTNSEVIEKDDLLRYLFVDNKNTKDDKVDTSKKILNNENEDWSIGNNEDIVTYKNYDEMLRYQKYPAEENKQLNYYTFLKLLSKSEGADDIIDLNEFENILNTIDKITSTSTKILDKKKGLLWENYNKMVETGEIPDIISMGKEVSEVILKSKDETTDLQLDVSMNNA